MDDRLVPLTSTWMYLYVLPTSVKSNLFPFDNKDQWEYFKKRGKRKDRVVLFMVS